MKNIYVLFCVFLILVIFSCRKPSPNTAALFFLKCWQNGKFDEAKKFGTASTNRFLDMYQAKQSDFTIKGDSLAGIEIISNNIYGDSATVRYKTNGRVSELNMVFYDDKWLVDLQMK